MLKLALAERVLALGQVDTANALFVEAHKDLRDSDRCSQSSERAPPSQEGGGRQEVGLSKHPMCEMILSQITRQLATSGENLPPLGELEHEVRAWAERLACGELPCVRGYGRRTYGEWRWKLNEAPEDVLICLQRALSDQYPGDHVDLDIQVTPGFGCIEQP